MPIENRVVNNISAPPTFGSLKVGDFFTYYTNGKPHTSILVKTGDFKADAIPYNCVYLTGVGENVSRFAHCNYPVPVFPVQNPAITGTF